MMTCMSEIAIGSTAHPPVHTTHVLTYVTQYAQNIFSDIAVIARALVIIAPFAQMKSVAAVLTAVACFMGTIFLEAILIGSCCNDFVDAPIGYVEWDVSR